MFVAGGSGASRPSGVETKLDFCFGGPVFRFLKLVHQACCCIKFIAQDGRFCEMEGLATEGGKKKKKKKHLNNRCSLYRTVSSWRKVEVQALV